MVNGFYIKGSTSDYNVDGEDSKTDLNNLYMLVKHDDGTTDTIIGCTTNKLS